MHLCVSGALAAIVASTIAAPLAAQTAPDATASGTPTAAAATAPAALALPAWLSLGAEYRGRAEASHGMPLDDGFYLNRIRVDADVKMAPWARVFVQAQDAHVLWANASPAPGTDAFDLRQGYLELARTGARGVSLRAGRQELVYGDARLVGNGEWGNTAMSFDAVKVAAYRPGIRVEGFAASVVRTQPGRFDTPTPDTRFYGVVGSITLPGGDRRVEPYVFAKRSRTELDEFGRLGDGMVYTSGVRTTGKLPGRLDYNVEAALQRGHRAGDGIAAWAGHYSLGWLVDDRSRMRPRVTVQINHASGDANPHDGRLQTFDVLYTGNHGYYDGTDQVGWRNMREAGIGFEFAPAPRWTVWSNLHRLSLATTQDAMYDAGGGKGQFTPAATSGDVGTAFDVHARYEWSKRFAIEAGTGALMAGDFLKQSGRATAMWTPYVMWHVNVSRSGAHPRADGPVVTSAQ
jgi:hypothetical protein